MNRPPDPRQQPAAFLRHLFDVAVARAQPLPNMAALLPAPPRGRTWVLGAGKAAGAMAHALEQCWPENAPLDGLVVTRYHHTPPRPAGLRQRIEICERVEIPRDPVQGVDGVEEIACALFANTSDSSLGGGARCDETLGEGRFEEALVDVGSQIPDIPRVGGIDAFCTQSA